MDLGELLQFPTREVKACNLEIEMEGLMMVLDESYELLDRLHESLHLMEMECAKFEEEFNEVIGRYVAVVGEPNVPIKYLEYSNLTEATFGESGEIILTWKGEEGMKLKDDILEKFENGATVFDIAKEHNTTVEAVMMLLGIEENAFD